MSSEITLAGRLNISDMMRRLGLSPHSASKIIRMGGVYQPIRPDFGDPFYHAEQVRLLLALRVGAITRDAADQEWAETLSTICAKLTIKPVAVLPRRKYTRKEAVHAS